MSGIISGVMIGSTVFVGLCMALGMLLGIFKGWKNGVLTLCRLAASLLLAFLATKILFLIVSPDAIRGLLSSFIESLLAGTGFEKADGLSALAGVLTVSGMVPFVFTALFVLTDLILILPAYFIGRAFGIGVKPEKLEERRKKKEAKRAAKAAEKAKTEPAAETEPQPETAAEAEPAPAAADEKAEVTADEKTGSNADEKAEAVEEKKEKKKGMPVWSRLVGGAVRAGVVAFTTLVIVLPVAGLMYCLTDGVYEVVDTAEEVGADIPLGQESVTLLGYRFTDENGMLDYAGVKGITTDVIEPVRSNIIFRAAYCAPFKAFYHSLSQARIDGHDYSLGDEMGQLFSLLKNSVYFLDDLGDFGDDQVAAIDGVTAYVSGSELHAKIGAELLSQFAQNAINSRSDIVYGQHSTITEPLFRTLANVTADSVVNDVNTIGEIGKIMIRYKVPYELAVSIRTSSYKNFRPLVGNEELIYELLRAVLRNEDYTGLVSPGLSYAFERLLISFNVYDEDITVASEAGKLTDEEIRTEAGHLAKLFGNGMDVIESLSAAGSSDAMGMIRNTDVEALGRFLDAAEESVLLGEGTRRLLIAVLKSSALDDMRSVADIIVKHLEAGENLDMENLLSAVKQVTILLETYQNGNADITEMTVTLNALVKSLGGSTGVIIKEIVNDSSVLNSSMLTGKDGTDNKYTQKLLSTMLDVMQNEEFTEEEIEKEAKALDYVMKLAKVSTDKSEAEGGMSSEQIKDIYNNDPEGIKEMVETIAESKLTTAAIKSIAYDENGALTEDTLKLTEKVDKNDIETIKEKCKEYYVESAPEMSAEEKKTLEENVKAIAAIFGENVTEDIAEWDKLIQQKSGS